MKPADILKDGLAECRIVFCHDAPRCHGDPICPWCEVVDANDPRDFDEIMKDMERPQ